jgi:hypothetical protein
LIVYLYRWKIKLGKEKQFEENWSLVTKAIRKECGSYGSRLHLTENNEYIGYAQWPDLETREKCELQDPSSAEARKLMRDAIEYSYPDQMLKIKSDLLVHP